MIVVHIGMPKSGSTSIQTFLRENDRRLRGMSIDYPRLGRKTRFQHQNFAQELRDNMKRVNPKLGSVTDLPEYIEQNTFDTTIISTEFFAWMQPRPITVLRDILASTGQNVVIIMIIRDLAGVVPSSYSQHVRIGNVVEDFDHFFEHRVERDRFNYFEVARRWAEVFGWDNMRVRLLEGAHLFQGDLIDDFFHTFGADTGARLFRRMPRPGRTNESSGWRVLEAMRALFGGRHGLDADHPLAVAMASLANTTDRRRLDAACREAGAAHGWMADRGRYLTRRQGEICRAAFHDALTALNEHLPIALPDPDDLAASDFITRDFLPDAALISADELRAFYDTAGRMLAADDDAPDDPAGE